MCLKFVCLQTNGPTGASDFCLSTRRQKVGPQEKTAIRFDKRTRGPTGSELQKQKFGSQLNCMTV